MSSYVPRNPSFFSTPFLILNLDALFYVLSNKFIIFIYSITIYYYYINLRWSIIFCLYSGDIYLPLNISPSFVSGLFFCDVFETLVILSTILFPIKSRVASAVFSIAYFEAVLRASVADFLAWTRSFWLYLLLKFLLTLLPIFLPIFLAKDKNPYPFTNIQSLGWTK